VLALSKRKFERNFICICNIYFLRLYVEWIYIDIVYLYLEILCKTEFLAKKWLLKRKKNLCGNSIREIKATFRRTYFIYFRYWFISIRTYIIVQYTYYLLRCDAEKYQAFSMLCNNAPRTVNTEISGNLCLRDEKIEIPWTESVVMNNAICSLKSSSESRERSQRNEKSDRVAHPLCHRWRI